MLGEFSTANSNKITNTKLYFDNTYHPVSNLYFELVALFYANVHVFAQQREELVKFLNPLRSYCGVTLICVRWWMASDQPRLPVPRHVSMVYRF